MAHALDEARNVFLIHIRDHFDEKAGQEVGRKVDILVVRNVKYTCTLVIPTPQLGVGEREHVPGPCMSVEVMGGGQRRTGVEGSVVVFAERERAGKERTRPAWTAVPVCVQGHLLATQVTGPPNMSLILLFINAEQGVKGNLSPKCGFISRFDATLVSNAFLSKANERIKCCQLHDQVLVSTSTKLHVVIVYTKRNTHPGFYELIFQKWNCASAVTSTANQIYITGKK